MSYNRIATPRAYIDLISFNLAHGWSTPSNISMLQNDGSTAVTFDSGQKEDLFDLRPSNFVTIEAENQAFYIQYDTEFSTDTFAESSFIAILGHNFHTADAVFKVQTDDASDMGSPTTVSTTGSHTKVINAIADAGAGYIDPGKNGWTLITWSTQTTNNRYMRITIEDDTGTGSNFNTDLKIGAILYGEYMDFPNSPDMSVKTVIDFDNTKLFAENMHSSSPSEWFDSDTIHSMFYNRILGQHLPFLFTVDGSVTEQEGDYGLFRLADSGMNSTQVAHRLWSMDLNLIETW
jgi:hypothetical protein